MVNEDISLSELPLPDVVLIDIEGYEFELLNENKWLLNQDIIFIVEVHDEGFIIREEWDPDMDPEGVVELFKRNRYTVNELSHKHILATPKRN